MTHRLTGGTLGVKTGFRGHCNYNPEEGGYIAGQDFIDNEMCANAGDCDDVDKETIQALNCFLAQDNGVALPASCAP